MGKTDIRYIVVVSDLHCGSTSGLCPPVVTLDDGGTYRQSKYQAWLWRLWLEFWTAWVPTVTRGEPYAVVVNDDAIEGNHHGITSVISANVSTQSAIALEVLSGPRTRAASFYITRGTEAHDGKACEAVEVLARMLDAKRCGTNASWWELDLLLGGRHVNLAHHIGTTSSAAYEASALNRELVAALAEAAQWCQSVPDVLVRSHRHRFAAVELPSRSGSVQCVVTPGWQLQTPFARKIATMRVPQIGGLCLSAEDDGIRVRRRIWAPEKTKPHSPSA